MVVTASEKHAVRVMQAVLEAMPTHPELAEFVVGDRAEPFDVLPIARAVAQSRDRVVFSLGYGRTPHGRVLSDFGPLGQPGGERLLAVAMTRARRSLVDRVVLHARRCRGRPPQARRRRARRDPG